MPIIKVRLQPMNVSSVLKSRMPLFVSFGWGQMSVFRIQAISNKAMKHQLNYNRNLWNKKWWRQMKTFFLLRVRVFWRAPNWCWYFDEFRPADGAVAPKHKAHTHTWTHTRQTETETERKEGESNRNNNATNSHPLRMRSSLTKSFSRAEQQWELL